MTAASRFTASVSVSLAGVAGASVAALASETAGELLSSSIGRGAIAAA